VGRWGPGGQHEAGETVEPAAYASALDRLQAYEFAVEDGADGQLGQGGVQCGQPPVLALAVAGEDPRPVRCDVRARPPAVPLPLEHPSVGSGERSARCREHRLDRAVEQHGTTLRRGRLRAAVRATEEPAGCSAP
jgi:hypothetical protein